MESEVVSLSGDIKKYDNYRYGGDKNTILFG